MHTQEINEYPEDIKAEFLRVSEWIRAVRKRHGNRIVIRLVDPQSVGGMWKVFRNRIRRYPTFFVDGTGRNLMRLSFSLPTKEKIIEGVQKALGLPPEKVPHNIERYGNTTAATLPILFHELVEEGRVRPGMLVAFTALGSGLHWGAALYRA